MAVNHFKEFGTVAEYEAYIQPDDYAKPLVALVDETQTVMFPQGGGGGDCGNPILTSVDVDDFTGTTLNEGVKYITGVTIPSGVTALGTNAFYHFPFTSFTIPSGITSIGDYAFYECTSLANVSFPSTFSTFGNSVFYGCTALTSVDLSGTSVTNIQNAVFYGCTSLTSVTFPSALTSIGDRAFYGCTALTSVDLSGTSLTTVKEGAFFANRNYTRIDLPSTVTSIGKDAFRSRKYLTLTVRTTTPPSLGNSAIDSTVSAIYVPAESVETYKAASGWSNFASKIQAIQ